VVLGTCLNKRSPGVRLVVWAEFFSKVRSCSSSKTLCPVSSRQCRGHGRLHRVDINRCKRSRSRLIDGHERKRPALMKRNEIWRNRKQWTAQTTPYLQLRLGPPLPPRWSQIAITLAAKLNPSYSIARKIMVPTSLGWQHPVERAFVRRLGFRKILA
jgi:hypothetical protein